MIECMAMWVINLHLLYQLPAEQATSCQQRSQRRKNQTQHVRYRMPLCRDELEHIFEYLNRASAYQWVQVSRTFYDIFEQKVALTDEDVRNIIKICPSRFQWIVYERGHRIANPEQLRFAFHQAIVRNRMDMVQDMMQQYAQDQGQDHLQKIPMITMNVMVLSFAIRCGDMDLLRFLSLYTVYTRQLSVEKCISLVHMCCSDDRAEKLQLILDMCDIIAQTEATSSDYLISSSLSTIVSAAIRSHQIKLANVAIRHPRFNVNDIETMMTAIKCECVPVLEYLIKHPAFVGLVGVTQELAWKMVSMSKNLPFVKLITSNERFGLPTLPSLITIASLVVTDDVRIARTIYDALRDRTEMDKDTYQYLSMFE